MCKLFIERVESVSHVIPFLCNLKINWTKIMNTYYYNSIISSNGRKSKCNENGESKDTVYRTQVQIVQSCW